MRLSNVDAFDHRFCSGQTRGSTSGGRLAFAFGKSLESCEWFLNFVNHQAAVGFCRENILSENPLLSLAYYLY